MGEKRQIVREYVAAGLALKEVLEAVELSRSQYYGIDKKKMVVPGDQ
ncbi:MAG: hypothetical protein KDC53_11845 [Saprospiraceae bacterium]|nr:hypothetical protein [Saprospiraceae bacterium]